MDSSWTDLVARSLTDFGSVLAWIPWVALLFGFWALTSLGGDDD